MIESPPIKILDEIAVNYHEDSQAPLHEIVRSGLDEIIEKHFVDGQRFWPETEVCERLHLSRVTVRRALNALSDQGRLTRHRSRGTFVRAAHGDSVSPERRSLPADGNVGSIGIVVPYLGSPFWSVAIDEVAAACAASGLDLHVYPCDQSEAASSNLAQLTAPPSDEAVLLLGNTHAATRSYFETLTLRGYRVVTIDMPIRGLAAPYVGVDNDMGVYIGVRHLLDLGHRRITLLNYEPPSTWAAQIRVNGFLSIAAECEIARARVFRADLAIAGGRFAVVAAAMEKIWRDRAERPTAVFCDSGACATAALKWCAEHGIDVPGELSLLSFDETRDTQYSRPRLTCISQPMQQIAQQALELAARPENKHVLLPPTLIVRASTAPPPAKRTSGGT